MEITVDDVTIPITEYRLKKVSTDVSRESSVSREPLNANKPNGDDSNNAQKQESDEDSD